MSARAARPCSLPLKQILAEVADGAFVGDPGGSIILWNRAAERLLGWSEQEVVGLACWEALAGADCNGRRLCGQGCQALRAGSVDGVHRLEMQTRTKGGHAVWLDITAFETPTSSGGRPAVVHLFRDVTATVRVLELIPRRFATLPGPAGLLSAREFQILSLMGAGANTKTMAARLRVSRATIRNHVQRILGKLDVHSRLEAVAWMHRRSEPSGGGGHARRGRAVTGMQERAASANGDTDGAPTDKEGPRDRRSSRTRWRTR
jgi:PAS domain S-box-containing protein